MPISGIRWRDGGGYDIHLMRGNHRLNLIDDLEFTGTGSGTMSASSYMSSNSDVTLEFTPSFDTTLDTSVTPNKKVGFGIKVNVENGTVEADPPPTSDPVIHNFILFIVATDTSDSETHETSIRIHLHNTVTSAWLSPPVLTLRPSGMPLPEQTEVRFSVRAEFDDGTVGDITHHPNIIWRPNSNVNGDGELKIDTGNTVSTPAVEIEAILPPDLEDFLSPSPPEIKATGHIRFAASWADEPTITAQTVQIQDTWPGTINPEVVPNFLFLCDGYKAADESNFDAQVRGLLGLMKTSKIARPFDLLATSMNYFSAFIPSNDHGVSVLPEVYPNQASDGTITVEADGTTKMYVLKDPEKPKSTGSWNRANLVYKFGLPVPAQAGLTEDQVRDYWDSIVSGIDRSKISDSTVRSWRKYAKRTFFEEVDSVFGLAYGRYPASSRETDRKNMGFHRYRMKRSNTQTSGSDRFLGGLDAILARMRGDGGTDLSELWTQRSSGTDPNSYSLIFIFSSVRWDRGVNYGRGYISMNVEDRYWIPAKQVTGKPTYEFELTGHITNDISHGRLIRGCHEIGHSFGLGDEYNETGTLPQSLDLDSFYGNLQKHSDIENPTTNQLDGDNIKWRWHRIKKAGVISDAITEPSSGQFKIPLVLGQANQFAVGDHVILRFREYPNPLPQYPEMSPPLEILEVVDYTDNTGSGSPEAFIKVRPKSGHTFTLANAGTFGEHSIVYLPVRAKESVFHETNYPYAEMIAKNIKDHITTRNRALNVDPSASQACSHDSRDIQEPVALDVDLPTCYKNKNRIVGIYTGGKTYDCGVYHPTGSCIMRNSNGDGKEFCAVCRFILVDIIDPYRHFMINRDYEEIYPQT